MSDDPVLSYPLSVDLPAGAMPQHALGIVAFFDERGETRYSFTLEGSSSLSSILGLLELVKARVLREAEEW